MSKVKITQVKSTIGEDRKYRKTLESLGLRRIGRSVVHEADPGTMGKLRQVFRLIKVEEVK